MSSSRRGELARATARALWRRLPPSVRTEVRWRQQRLRAPAWPGTLRRVTPVSSVWGRDRGTPLDRFYIEQFLAEHRADIRGRVLEVQNRRYTERFGTDVQCSDVLDIDPTNPLATVVADLVAADTIPSNSFDCVILTQTLQLLVDVPAALHHLHRILRPGGVLLLTAPSVSKIAPEAGVHGDYWRFTLASGERLLAAAFGPGQAQVRTYGSVLTCIAFLAGMAWEELSSAELAAHDPYFPLLVAGRAVKA